MLWGKKHWMRRRQVYTLKTPVLINYMAVNESHPCPPSPTLSPEIPPRPHKSMRPPTSLLALKSYESMHYASKLMWSETLRWVMLYCIKPSGQRIKSNIMSRSRSLAVNSKVRGIESDSVLLGNFYLDFTYSFWKPVKRTARVSAFTVLTIWWRRQEKQTND